MCENRTKKKQFLLSLVFVLEGLSSYNMPILILNGGQFCGLISVVLARRDIKTLAPVTNCNSYL